VQGPSGPRSPPPRASMHFLIFPVTRSWRVFPHRLPPAVPQPPGMRLFQASAPFQALHKSLAICQICILNWATRRATAYPISSFRSFSPRLSRPRDHETLHPSFTCRLSPHSFHSPSPTIPRTSTHPPPLLRPTTRHPMRQSTKSKRQVQKRESTPSTKLVRLSYFLTHFPFHFHN
jgi:hypothetical protein